MAYQNTFGWTPSGQSSIYNKATTEEAQRQKTALENSPYYKQDIQAKQDFSGIKGYDPTGLTTNDPNAARGWMLFQDKLQQGQNPVLSDSAKYGLDNLNLQQSQALGNAITSGADSGNLTNNYIKNYQQQVGSDLSNTANRYMSTYDLAKAMDTAQKENSFNLWKKYMEHLSNLYTADKTE